MADSGVWRWQMEVLRARFPGLPLTSGYRPGAITATGNPSYHGKGQAVDIPPRMDVFEWIKANYPDSAELIYSPAGRRQIHNGREYQFTGVTRAQHYDHIHWAYPKGQAGGGPSVVPANNPGETPSLNPLQPIIDLFNFIFDPGMWLRLGIGVAGGAMVLFAFLAITGRRVTTIVRSVAKNAR